MMAFMGIFYAGMGAGQAAVMMGDATKAKVRREFEEAMWAMKKKHGCCLGYIRRDNYTPKLYGDDNEPLEGSY